MKFKEESIKVKIGNKFYWFLQNYDGSGAIAPLEHCDKNGNLDFFTCFSSDTFAHVQNDRTILRYGKNIGIIDDYIK